MITTWATYTQQQPLPYYLPFLPTGDRRCGFGLDIFQGAEYLVPQLPMSLPACRNVERIAVKA